MSDEHGFLETLFERMERYEEPCEEFVKFRKLLDKHGIEWVDESDIYGEGCNSLTMHRTQSPGGRERGFSCIWGYGSYGADAGLLELCVSGDGEPEGWLTAEEAMRKVLEAKT